MSGGLSIPLIDFSPLAKLGETFAQMGQREEAQRLLSQQLDAAVAAQGQQGSTALSPLGTPVASQSVPAVPNAAPGRLPSFAGGSAAMTVPNMGGDNEKRFVGALQAGGLTNPYGLAAVAAYANRESGYKGSNINGSWSDPSERGQPGTSGGILSWRGDRLANMRKFTAGATDPVTAQAQFMLTENPRLTQALQNADSAEEANRLMANAWMFAGYNRPGGENAARLNATRSYLARLNGGGFGDAGAATPPTMVAAASGPGAIVPGTNPARPPMTLPAASGATSMPQQQAAAPAADMPASGAQPVGGYAIPGSGQVVAASAGSDFTPGTVASPALAQPGAASSTALAPAAAQRITPAQAQNLRAMLANPMTQGYAAKIIEGLNKPAEFSFQVVGDQLIRTSKDGRAEVMPGISKPPTFSVTKGSDGNDYILNPQTGALTRAVAGKDSSVRSITDPGERASYGIPPNYTGPAQVDAQGQLSFPGSGQLGITGQQKAEDAASVKGAQTLVERFDAVGKEGQQGRTDLPLIGEMRALSGEIGTGASAAIQAKLGEYGIKLGDNAGRIEAFNALVDRLTPQQRIPGAGATSDFDARMFKGSLPRLINTPEGNALIVDTLEAMAKDRIARGDIADRALLGPDRGGISAQEAMAQLKGLPSIRTPFAQRMQELQKSGKLSASAPAGAPSGERRAPGGLDVGASTVIEGVTIKRVR